MDILRNLLPFVNEQIGIQKKLVDKYPEDWRKALHSEVEKKFQSMAEDIQTAILEYAKLQDKNSDLKQEIDKLNLELKRHAEEKSEIPKNTYQLLSLHPDELTDLPQDLLDELSDSARDKTEIQILEIVSKNEGIITLDQLLVRLYLNFGEKFKRNVLNARLYKLTQAKALYSIPGRKGVYSNKPIEDSFSQDQEDSEI